MNKIFRKLLITIAIIIPVQFSFAMQSNFAIDQKTIDKAIDIAKYANQKIFSKFYKAESVRTALIRSAMALYCLSDGSCNSQDAMVLALAVASNITAFTYDANSNHRCWWLPAKFNLMADGIATVASFDAGWIPITSTKIEKWTRCLISCGSVSAAAIDFLYTKYL